ncbi:MAG TPA: biopolymer transporter ExbD [Longimicrobiales bacterium]|jgi:biopolymer transport protein ExbD|nr:biopolymer transporter ExbD [Longimicrobiales bacterium]
MMRGGLERKSKASSEIPSSSLADMAFLLLIFFMVSTVFRKEQPRDAEFPEAEATQKLEEPRKDILHIWVEGDGDIWINDQNIAMQAVAPIVNELYVESNQRLVPVLRADRDVPYSVMNDLQEQLQTAGTVRVTFYTNLEQRMARARR